MGSLPGGIEKIARILRVDKDEVLLSACQHLEKVTGRRGVLNRIAEEVDAKVFERLEALGVPRAAGAAEVYNAIISKVEADDLALYDLFRKPDYSQPEAYKTVLGFAREISRAGEGFFLKHEKAREFLERQPPNNILEALGYQNISDLLAKEDLLEVFSALRFLESSEWLNSVFFKQYETITPADFEKRPIELRVLSPQWVRPAEKFMQKKHHNLSHLKELGVCFVIPWTIGHTGETLRMFGLLVHYMHEISFYARLFSIFSEHPRTFAENVISSLRGDIPDKRPDDIRIWLIVQR